MLQTIRIVRFEQTSEGTFGIMFIDENPVFTTLEPRTWNNERNLSCIPSGWYACDKIVSEKHGETFEVLNVKDRSEIIFHVGNWIKDTKGCILLGLKVGTRGRHRMIINSRKAMSEFMDRFSNVHRFVLQITEILTLSKEDK